MIHDKPRGFRCVSHEVCGFSHRDCLVASIYASASVPSDAQVIGLDQRIESSAPGAHYKVQVSLPGTLSVILDQVPDDMLTRIAVINEADAWLAERDTSAPGQLITVKAKAESTGWYYIGVLDLEGKTHDNNYAFHMTWVQ
jgi:hypothetical protein